MARSSKHKKLYSILRGLRVEYPLDKPLIVRRKKMRHHFGWASQGEKSYYIYLNHQLDESLAIYFLLHEYAHCRVYDVQFKDHGQAWAKEYGRIYAWYEKIYLK